ncbi:Pentatricopeptide repeat-containing protein [Rhynchospora pubera]|uniref:Pentatricopeptide repeat-containing protein n=1 Tax=Rhynchospora pubera TaxID=906938 RepID=A0AAV8C9N6_9POAL|nr:Pentatricopeptide repeat-containing protein [Rhynchospora pubera]
MGPIATALRRLSSASSISPHLRTMGLTTTTTTTTCSPSFQLPEPTSSPHHYSNPNHRPIHSQWPQARAFNVLTNHSSSSLLASLSSNPSIGPARKVFDEMLQRNVPFNTLGFGLFIAKLSKTEKEIENILRIVEQIKKRHHSVNGSIVAFLIVNALCKTGRKDDAWKALEELRNIDCKPDFIVYRTVSEEFRLAKQYEEESRILKQKRKLGVAPRERDYREFIYLLIHEKRIKEAKEVAEAIVDGDFPIDLSLLNTLIGSVSDIDTESAIKFCKYMVQKGSLPTIKSLSTLCKNLCKNEMGDDLWEILGIILQQELFISPDYYRLTVSFLCKAGKVREAYDVIKDMRRKRMEPEIFCYNSLMRALCKHDLLRPAKKLWDEMFTRGCQPNLQTYNILIKKFSEIGEVQEAKGLYQKMIAKGVLPDNYTIGFLIGLFCNENKLDEAISVLNQAIEQDLKLGSLALTELVISLCRQGNFKEVLKILSGVTSNIDTLNSHLIFLKSLVTKGEVDMAMQHVHWINANTNFILERVLNELISSLSTAPNLENVIKLIQALNSKGLLSNGSPYMSLLQDYDI